MKIINRYLIGSYLWPLFFCVLFFIFMFVFVDSLSNLDEFIRNKAPLSTVLAYYGFLVPVVIAQIMPAASLMAALYFLGHLNKNNEIVALKASGVSGFHILLPLLFAGLLLSVSVMTMNELVVPDAALNSSAIKKGIIESGNTDLKMKALNNVTLLASDNRMIYARELRLDTQTLHDVIILSHNPDLTLKSKTTGRTAVYENNDWTLHDAVHYELDSEGYVLDKPETFRDLKMDIHETPTDFIQQEGDTQFMNFNQLKRYLENTKLVGFKTSNRMLVDLYQKAANPFTTFVILLVGVPVALQTRRGGAMLSVGVGLLIVSGYYVLIAIASALGRGGAIPPLAAVLLPHAMYGISGIYLLRKYI